MMFIFCSRIGIFSELETMFRREREHEFCILRHDCLPDVVVVIKSLGASVRLCDLVERVHWTQHAEELFVHLLTNRHSEAYRALTSSSHGARAGLACSRFHAPGRALTEEEKRRQIEERGERIRQGFITQPGPRRKRMRKRCFLSFPFLPVVSTCRCCCACACCLAELSMLRDDEFDDRYSGEDVLYQFQEKRAFVELCAEQSPLMPRERLEQLLGSASRSGTSLAPIDLTSSSSSTSLGDSQTCASALSSMDAPRVLVRLWVEELEPDSKPFQLAGSRSTLLDVGAELAAASFTLPLSSLARYMPEGSTLAIAPSDN